MNTRKLAARHPADVTVTPLFVHMLFASRANAISHLCEW